MSLIWASTTSRILLNGEPGRPIQHRRGLRQGDPLSPMRFILAMDPLQQLLAQATGEGLLHHIGSGPVKMHTSLYADDAVLFIRWTPWTSRTWKDYCIVLGRPPDLRPMWRNRKYSPYGVTTSTLIKSWDSFKQSEGNFHASILGCLCIWGNFAAKMNKYSLIN